MHITSITTPQKVSTAFDVYVEFVVDDQEFDEIEMSGEIYDISEWASNTFESNFVILAHASKIVAGGCADNAKAWREQWKADEQWMTSDSYEIRGSDSDIALFLLKYKKL